MERKVIDAKKKIVQDMEKVNFKLHHLNTNPDPIGTRDLYFVNRTFNIVLQNMKERTAGNLVNPASNDPTSEHEMLQKALRSGCVVRSKLDWLIRFREDRTVRNICSIMDQVRDVISIMKQWAEMY